MYDLHVHDVDYTNYLLGMPETIHAFRRVSDPPGRFDIIHADYQYRAGTQVHIHGGWGLAQIPFKAGYEAWFEHGFLRFDPAQEPALVIYDDQGKVKPRPAAFEPGDAYLNEIAYFLDCIEKDIPPSECPPESARDSLALLEKEINVCTHGSVYSPA